MVAGDGPVAEEAAAAAVGGGAAPSSGAAEGEADEGGEVDALPAHAVADRSGVAADAVMRAAAAAEVQQAEQLVKGATEAAGTGTAKKKKKKKKKQRRPRGQQKRGAGHRSSIHSRQAGRRGARGGTGADRGGAQV